MPNQKRPTGQRRDGLGGIVRWFLGSYPSVGGTPNIIQ